MHPQQQQRHRQHSPPLDPPEQHPRRSSDCSPLTTAVSSTSSSHHHQINSNSNAKQQYHADNPQTAATTSTAATRNQQHRGASARNMTSSTRRPSHRKDLPPLFWYMELGDWEKATARAKSHPKEVKSRATLRTKSSMADDGTQVTGTKRLALHHACFKLRSAGSAPIAHAYSTTSTTLPSNDEDHFLAVCKFILLLLDIFPEACQVRESRHGCLPLHLAAFASCYVRQPGIEHEEDQAVTPTASNHSGGSKSSFSAMNSSSHHTVPSSSRHSPTGLASAALATSSVERPGVVSARSTSESTASTAYSNMTAILMEESFAGHQTLRKKEGAVAPPPLTPHPVSLEAASASETTAELPLSTTAPPLAPAMSTQQTIFISNKREQMAVKVLNAMLDAYPRAIRLDSEGGRLPLHTACAGRATPRCVSLLLRAYPGAARHRNKDGFLPLHLAAHWGVSHPNVAITLLKAYPDATVGRNRWERTPLEEALVMAGENGRPHQAPLVRALRKHPSYWTRPPKELFQAMENSGGLGGSNLVDTDVTLPSSDGTSLDDNPRYFNAGFSLLLEDEQYEKVPEGEETQVEYDHRNINYSANQGGIMSRLTRRRSGPNDNINNSPEITQDLKTLIKNLKWKSVIARLEINPDEANEEMIGIMTRGGFQASSAMTPLHYACERKPPVEVVQALIEANPEAVTERMMPGGCLPLHVACTWHSSPSVVSALLSADPSTAKVVDELGNRPLHSACFSGAAFSVVQDLLAIHPKAVLSRNNQGSQPIDICRRLKHANRRAVMTALLEKKDYIMAKQQKHGRSKSSGSMGGLAQTATTMNDQYGSPSFDTISPIMTTSFDADNSTNNIGKDEDMPGVGVEVTYQDQGKSHTLLWI